jgi:hypothetical protein
VPISITYRQKMGALGEDLVLLAIDPGNGALHYPSRLPYALMGAELAELAAISRIGLVGDRIVLTGPGGLVGQATGDVFLDTTLAGLAAARRPPRPVQWVNRTRRDITGSYLNKLAAAAVIQRRGGILVPKWSVVNPARATAARNRLNAVAFGGRYDFGQASLAALVVVTGLSRTLYPGAQNEGIWKRLGQVSRGNWIATAVRQAITRAEQRAAQHAAFQRDVQERQRRRRRDG